MWTEEKIEKLVEHYKEHPLLWDPNDKNYKNRARKHEALKNISAAMSMEVVDIERKLGVLQTQFRRTHRKVLNMKKSGMVAEDVEKNIWYGYKLLSFLQDRFNNAFLKAVTQESTTTTTTTTDAPRRSTAIIYPPILPNGYQPVTVPGTQTRVAGSLNDTILLMNNLPQKRQAAKDEYDFYGEQIACKLRKMDEITRINTQHLINNIIHETEMKLLNRRYGYPEAQGSPLGQSTSPGPPAPVADESDNEQATKFSFCNVKQSDS